MYDKKVGPSLCFCYNDSPGSFLFWRQETRENCAKSGTSRTKRITSYHTSGTEVAPLLKHGSEIIFQPPAKWWLNQPFILESFPKIAVKIERFETST